MPNWCYSHLHIQGGNPAAVLEAIAGKNGAMDFNRVIPMPPELNIESGAKTEIGLLAAQGDSLGEWADKPWVKEKGITTPRGLAADYGYDYGEVLALGKQALENKRRFGAATWYEWAEREWGTKWNAVDPAVMRTEPQSAELCFRTAGGPPIPVIRKLSELWPERTFRLGYSGDLVNDGNPYGVFIARGYQVVEIKMNGIVSAMMDRIVSMVVLKEAKSWLDAWIDQGERQSPAEIRTEPAGGPDTYAIPGQPGEVPSPEQAMREFVESIPPTDAEVAANRAARDAEADS